VAATEPSFRPGTVGWIKRRYWRGPTWINAAWLLWLGLVRLGYEESARTLAAGIEKTIVREGLWEYFNPYSGEGLGATDFAWSALAMEMAEPDLEAAARSYL
jgi:glycogen debranching enzyme